MVWEWKLPTDFLAICMNEFEDSFLYKIKIKEAKDNVHHDCLGCLRIYFGVITEKKGMKKCIMTYTF